MACSCTTWGSDLDSSHKLQKTWLWPELVQKSSKQNINATDFCNSIGVCSVTASWNWWLLKALISWGKGVTCHIPPQLWNDFPLLWIPLYDFHMTLKCPRLNYQVLWLWSQTVVAFLSKGNCITTEGKSFPMDVKSLINCLGSFEMTYAWSTAFNIVLEFK